MEDVRWMMVHHGWFLMVHLRWKGLLSLFQTVALPFPLVTTPSGLLFSAKLASPNG